jgi:arylsulfatase A-like enzyme
VPFTAVHVPIAEPEKYLAMNSHVEDEGQRLYAADMSHLDDCVRQIIAALEQKGVRDNTLVLFLSDNGAHPPMSDKEPNYPGADTRPDVKVGGVNTPLRGYKTQVYEGGIRTPAIAHWPARWKPTAIQTPLSVTDWLPTLCALAGVTPPATLKLDGADISPLLSGTVKEADFVSHPIYSVSPSYKARMVRRGPWKLVENGSAGGKKAKGDLPSEARELFNVSDDISETKNLISEQPKIVEELTALLAQFATDDQPSKKATKE